MGILDLLSTGNQYADPNGLYAGLMGHKGIAGYFENASNPAAMATQRPPQDGWEPGGQYPQGMPSAPPAHKPGFFGRGGAAWGILGSLSDAAAVAGGGQPYFGEDIRRQREKRMDQQNVMDRFVAEEQDKRDRLQAINLGDGGVATYGQNAGLNVIREPSPHVGEQRALLDEWSNPETPADRKQMIGYMLRGANLRPDVYQPQINARVAGQLGVKQAPTYAAMHPSAGGSAGGTGRFGHTKSNPYPVNSRGDLEAVPRGTWVSLPNGQVTQRR